MQRHQPVLRLQRLAVIPGQAGLLHVRHHPRRHVRGDRDHAHAALRVEPVRRGVLARDLHELLAAGDPLVAHAGQVAGRVLHPDDPRQLGQLAHRLGRHVDHRPPRNVVDDDRQLAAIVQRGEMRDQAPLGWLVVVGRHHQRGIGAHLLGVLHEADRLDRVVRAGPGDHRNPPRRGAHHLLDHRLVLGMGQRRALAGRAHGHKAVAALGDMPFNKFLERLKIQLAVLERRDQGRKRSFEHDTLH